MVYAYYRYSTNKQSEMQQEHRVKEYCQAKGITIDAVVIDRGVSGSTAIENRNLAELIGRMKPGDTIVVSEISRISRSIGDFYQFIQVTMPKLQARVIVCNVNLDIDCKRIDAFTNIFLTLLATFAQMERDLLKDRVQAGLDARKKELTINGGFTTKKGDWCTKLGSPTGFKNGVQKIQAEKKIRNFMRGMAPVAAVIRDIKANHEDLRDWDIAVKLNQMGFKTGNGGKIYNYHIPKILRYDEEGIYY